MCENRAARVTYTHFGNLTCPRGYQPEFVGFAFSNYYSHKKGEYVCIDVDAEGFPNSRGSSNDDEGIIVSVEFQCGSLPCPPFYNNREVPCVQCSKVIEDCVFFKLGMDCVQSCPQGFYNDSEKICRKCHQECAGCVGPNSSDCLNCQHYKTVEGLCVVACPSDYSPDQKGDCILDKSEFSFQIA